LKKVNTPPHRAKLVQIPIDTTIREHNSTFAVPGLPILSTSQFRFPRKPSAERSDPKQSLNSTTVVPLSSYINRVGQSGTPSSPLNIADEIPIQITQTYSPTHKIPKTYLKTNNTDNSIKACVFTFVYYFKIDFFSNKR